MKELVKDHVFGINGKEGLIGVVVDLVKAGKDVCIDNSYHIGNGNYVVAYFDDVEAPVEILDQPVVDDVVEPAPTPDWDLAKGFINEYGADEAKDKLIAYAGLHGVTKDKLDKRKGYSRILTTFKNVWEQK